MKNWLPILSAALPAALLPQQAEAKQTPNVVIIYGDDVGFGDVGVYGAKLIPTPNLDRMAAEGIQFTDAHCSAATCTPSRYSLLTGRLAFREHIHILPGDAKMAIPTDVLTLPKLFKKGGYTTGVIGKWHLGLGDGKTPIDWNGDVKPGPLELGFDHSFLVPATNDRVPCVYLDGHKVVGLDANDPISVSYRSPLSGKSPSGKAVTVYPDGKKNPAAMTYYRSSMGHNNSVINGIGRIGYMQGGKAALWNDETMADVLVDKARHFIAANRTKPFFLYFASQDIHVPRTPHPRFKGKSQLGYRGDAMVQLDWATGEIIKALKKHGLDRNTIVIFSSDNGPVYDDGYHDGCTVHTSRQEVDRGHDGSGPYRGGKYQIYEGGTRVPFIVWSPYLIKAQKSEALFSQVDLLGSFASMLKIALPENEAIDSRDTFQTLIGRDTAGVDFVIQEAGKLAISTGDWKYINQPAQLYNLREDIMEQNNLVKSNPQKAAELKQLLDRVKAQSVRAID